VALPAASYNTNDRSVAFFDEVTKKLRAIPGVVNAAAVGQLPIAAGGARWSIMIDGVVLRTIGESPSLAPQQVTPEYFKVMSTPIVAGRAFEESDRMGAPFVVIVNEEAARMLWKGANPIGRTIKMFDSTAAWATVIGVVKDTRAEGISADVPPTMYFPHAQATRTNYGPMLTMSLVAKTRGNPEALGPALREAVRSIDPLLPITSLRSMESVVSTSIADRTFSTALLLLFAVLAMVLAGIGIYGVIAFSVSMRTYEIGVRVALGAHRASVIGLVLKQSLAMTAVGIAVGVLGAIAVTRAARSMLVGITNFDPATLVIAAVSIMVVALLAGVVPVRRALRVDPILALRNE
jgi:putative ABC transport system permease protein